MPAAAAKPHLACNPAMLESLLHKAALVALGLQALRESVADGDEPEEHELAALHHTAMQVQLELRTWLEAESSEQRAAVGGGVMVAEWSGWLLHLRGAEGCLHQPAANGLPDESELIAMLAMLGDVVGRVANEMEQARDDEMARDGGLADTSRVLARLRRLPPVPRVDGDPPRQPASSEGGAATSPRVAGSRVLEPRGDDGRGRQPRAGGR
jgi:hypothetical protein